MLIWEIFLRPRWVISTSRTILQKRGSVEPNVRSRNESFLLDATRLVEGRLTFHNRSTNDPHGEEEFNRQYDDVYTLVAEVWDMYRGALYTKRETRKRRDEERVNQTILNYRWYLATAKLRAALPVKIAGQPRLRQALPPIKATSIRAFLTNELPQHTRKSFR